MTEWRLTLGGLPPLRSERPRVKSLLSTVFGDVVSAHGGVVNLAGLIQIGAAFGSNERNVRTAVYRMAGEGWLVGQRLGRTSYYRLSPHGRERFTAARRRVYGVGGQCLRKRWQLIIAPQLSVAAREILHRDMRWLGFAKVAAGVLIGVDDNTDKVNAVLGELGLCDSVFVFSVCDQEEESPRRRNLWRRFVAERWNLSDVENRHRIFLQTFRLVWRRLQKGAVLSDWDALKLRVFLIHEFRRALLPDPDLPLSLLPAQWHGHQARDLCTDLYRHIAASGEKAARLLFCTPAGEVLPPADDDFWQRFGGIHRRAEENEWRRQA